MLQNGNLPIRRYMIEDTKVLVIVEDGRDAPEVLAFLRQQPEVIDVEIDQKSLPGLKNPKAKKASSKVGRLFFSFISPLLLHAAVCSTRALFFWETQKNEPVKPPKKTHKDGAAAETKIKAAAKKAIKDKAKAKAKAKVKKASKSDL